MESLVLLVVLHGCELNFGSGFLLVLWGGREEGCRRGS